MKTSSKSNKTLKNAALLVFFIFFSNTSFAQFVTQWKTDNPGPSSNNQIEISMRNVGNYSYTVDWGDLTSTTYTNASLDLPPTHTYSSPGTYTVSITHDSGVYPGIRFENTGDKDKLISIDSWGTQEWRTLNSAFSGCTNLVSSPAAAPVFSSSFNNLGSAFRDCSSFTGDLSSWDVSTVVNMNNLFRGATLFNSDLSSWTTSSLLTMSSIFNGAAAFTSDLTNFNVSMVNTMSRAFSGATLFNGDISSFAPSASLTSIAQIFNDAVTFNQDISDWNTSAVTNMNAAFSGATAFNQSLGDLDLSNNPKLLGFLNNSGISIANYDATLSGWNSQNVSDLSVGVLNLVYCNDGEAARSNLESPTSSGGLGWTLSGHSACTTLPIDLVSFKVNNTGNNTVALTWQTATEVINDFFTIERSADARNWKTIAEVNGAGNSSELLSYISYDEKPLRGLAYYRLKQTDFDGKYVYSDLVTISRADENIGITLSPNPATHSISLTNPANIKVAIYNVLGKEVTQQTTERRNSANKTIIDLSSLAQGVYFVKVGQETLSFLKE